MILKVHFAGIILKVLGFPGGPVVKNPPHSVGDGGSFPGREDTTCLGATEPVRHNRWARVQRLPKLAEPGACALQQGEPAR